MISLLRLLSTLASLVHLDRFGGFKWIVAARYLRMTKPRSAKIHIITAILATLVVAMSAIAYAIDHLKVAWIQDLRFEHAAAIRMARLGTIVAFVILTIFIMLVRRLTIFTTISTFGLFLGTGALVIVLSVMSGFENDLRHKILGANAHIVVQTPDHAFTGYDALRTKLAALPDVVGVTPFITNEVMISSSSNLSGVVVKGIDTATVAQVTELSKQIDVGGLDYLTNPEKLKDVSGPPLLEHEDDEKLEEAPKDAPKDTVRLVPADEAWKRRKPEKPDENRRVLPGVIIGRELAKNLRLYLGDDVNIVSPLGGIGPSGPIPKSKPFRVAGVFFSGMFEYDSKYIYLSIPAAQKFLGQEDEVTGLELKVKDPDDTDGVVAAIKATLGPDYDVQSWKELNRNLFSALKLEKIAMFIVLCFIILVAAFSIIANGIMLVMEKGREIAILKSMGAKDSTIMTVFMLLGLYMGGLGTLSGILVGVGACRALVRWGLPLDPDVYYITQLPVKMNPNEIVLVAVAAIGIAVLATLYPAWVAARLKPVEGLREGSH